MPETILLNATITVANGPKLSLTRSLDVEAYDKLDVTVPDTTTGMEVQLQPGGSGQVQFMLVTADPYDDDLTYTVNSGTTAYKLDQPHLLSGAGAVSILDPAPEKLVFDNNSGKDARVQILIGRDATP